MKLKLDQVLLLIAALLFIFIGYKSISIVQDTLVLLVLEPTDAQVLPTLHQKNYDYNLARVYQSNIFGSVGKTPITVVKKVKKTTLNLALVGTLAADQSQFARALIKSKNKVKLYSVDEKVDHANAKIAEIGPFSVILNRNGVLEALYLKRKTGQNNQEYTDIKALNIKNEH